jgi:DNA polymerase III delta prime subunit
MLNPRLLFIAVLLLPAFAAAQDVYRWVDEDGEVHHGNMVPPEYRNYGWERIGPNGNVIERIERALTPEEREALRLEQQRKAELEAARERQETRDRMLLNAYRSEQDLLDEMERQVESLDTQRATIQASLDLASERFETMVRRAAQTVREGGNVSADLTANIEEARAEIASLREDLASMADREREIRERFMGELERYRQLSENTAG